MPENKVDSLDVTLAKLDHRVEELEEKVKGLNSDNHESHKRMYGRIEELEKFNIKFDTSFQNLLVTVGEIKEKFNQLYQDIKELKSKPAKRWEAMIGAIIAAIIAGIVGFAIAQFFGK